ncbi:MAG: hypothetical protein ACLPH3_04645 [Terracidiphilus sp.]
MQSYPQTAVPRMQAHPSATKQPRQRGDMIYQVMTVAAMLIVLVSVWIF